MGAEIDSLEIKLQANAQSANRSLDALVKKLDVLSTSLGRVNGNSLTSLSNGVQRLANSMQSMKSVGTADFSRLAKNIQKMGDIDAASVSKAASSLHRFSNALSRLDTIKVSDNAAQIGTLANGIKQLGYKSTAQAINNIPKLAAAMKQLMTTLSSAPKVSQNLINMTNALANLARTGASSGRAASSLSNSLNTYAASTSLASKGTFSLASAIGKLYAGYWLLFRAFSKIGEAINISSDLTEVQNVVDVTFGDMAYKVEEFAETSIEQFGMSELALKQYASRFQAMGSAMGIDKSLIANANSFLSDQTNGYIGLSDSMSDVSLNLTKLTADMASFYNMEQSDVAEDLESIFTGQTRPLRTYGLDLTEATLKEWAFKNGLDADIDSMSQAEKTMLRYQYVLANTGAAQGDFARTADTWANQVRILKQNFQQLAGVVGGVFINALKPLVRALNAAMSHIIAFAETISNALGKIFGWKYESGGGGVASDFEDAAGSADDIADSTGDAAKNIDKMQKGIRAFDELKTISISDSDSSSGSGSGSGSSSGGSADGGQWVEQESIFDTFESEIDSLYELGEYIGEVLTNAMNDINWESVYQGARNFGKGLAEFLNGLISPELFGATGRTIAGALNTAIYAALSFGETFDWYDFGDSIAEGINEFFETFDFGALATTLNTWVDGIEEAIVSTITNIEWGDVFEGFHEFFSNLELDTAFLVVIPAIRKFWQALKAGKIGTWISKFKSLSNAVMLVVQSLGGNKTALATLTTQYPKFGKAVDVARQAFANFRFGIENGNFMTGLNEGITTIRDNLTGLQKGIITVAAGFVEFEIVSSVFEGLVDGSEDVVAGVAKIGVTVGVAAAAMYVALGPAGVVVAAITGVVAAISGINKAVDELQMDSMFETIKTNGVTSLESLGTVATTAFGNITNGVETTIEKLNSISETRESIDSTVESIGNIKSAIDNGAYSVSEKVPQIIEQFQTLLNDSKTVLEEEYDVIVGNIVGAWADVLTAQGQSIPEFVTGLLDMTNQGKTAYADLETSLNSLIEQYNNGKISAEDFYAQSEPLFNQLSTLNSDGSIDNAAFAIHNLGGALDMSQYIKDGTFDTTAFQSYMDTVVQTAQDGKDSLETLRTENQATLDAYKQQLDGLGVDTANYDWAALYGASETQVTQGISDINAAYQDYANQVQYCLLEQLPAVVDDATAGYEELGWWEKMFTTKEDYVQGEIDKWKGNVLAPATDSLQSGFEQLGIDGETWSVDAADKITSSLFDTVTEYSYEGVPLTTTTLRNDWETILTNALSGAAEAVDAEAYGKDTVDGYINGITNSEEESCDKIQEWMESLDEAIHDSALEYGSPSKRTEEYGKWTIEGFNNGILDNSSKTVRTVKAYMNTVNQTFSGIVGTLTEIGVMAMNGLINGLSSKETELYAKANRIADNTAKTIKNALDIHSPSRVMFELGGFTMEGFQNGMESLYQPILASAKSFASDLEVAPVPQVCMSYQDYRMAYDVPSCTQSASYENTYGQDNSETNSILRELLTAVKQGKQIVIDGNEVGRTAVNYIQGEERRLQKSIVGVY